MDKDRMELWTDKTFTHFAIRFNEIGFVAASNSKTIFMEIIDERPCNDCITYDWKRTLTEWVNIYLRKSTNSKYKFETVGKASRHQGSTAILISPSAAYSKHPPSQLFWLLLRCDDCQGTRRARHPAREIKPGPTIFASQVARRRGLGQSRMSRRIL